MDSMYFNKLLKEKRIIVAMRKVPTDKLEGFTRALKRGGIGIVEVPINQFDEKTVEESCAQIKLLKNSFEKSLCIGAGTVITDEQLYKVKEAGADFVISPVYNKRILNLSKELGLPAISGAFSPSEILEAWNITKMPVKVFPVDSLGVGFCQALRGPLGFIPLVPMGGIDLSNINEYLSLDNVGVVGVGSSLVDMSLIANNDWDSVTKLAKSFCNAASI